MTPETDILSFADATCEEFIGGSLNPVSWFRGVARQKQDLLFNCLRKFPGTRVGDSRSACKQHDAVGSASLMNVTDATEFFGNRDRNPHSKN